MTEQQPPKTENKDMSRVEELKEVISVIQVTIKWHEDEEESILFDLSEIDEEILSAPEQIPLPRDATSLEEKLETKKGKKRKNTREEKEIDSLETKIDKKKYPLKWFIISKLKRRNFRILFEGNDKKSVSASIVNKIIYADDPEGREVSFWDNPVMHITQERDNVVIYSSNGFYLKLINKKKLQESGEGVIVDGPDARYDLIDPSGSTLLTNINYEEGEKALNREAQQYQKGLLDLFENQLNLSAKEKEKEESLKQIREKIIEESRNLKQQERDLERAMAEEKRREKEPTPVLETTESPIGAEEAKPVTQTTPEETDEESSPGVTPETWTEEDERELRELEQLMAERDLK